LNLKNLIKTGFVLFLTVTTSAFADTPASLIAGYTAEAAQTTPGFTASAQRGQAFFVKKWTVSDKMPDCTACHGKDLRIEGKHVITGKRIDAFSPAVNTERFTSLKKVEKWFKRNCTEVTGRECTAAEKADFLQFVSQGN
jgi:hypothetical protein